MSMFAEGVVVQLKSGGPKMTCIGGPKKQFNGTTTICCQWFAGSKLESGLFVPETLIVVEEPKKAAW